MSSIPPEMQAWMDQSSERSQQLMDLWAQMAKESQDQSSKQMVLQYANRNLTREAYAAFERAMNAAMSITGQRHAEREREYGGTGDIPIPLFHSRESRDKAPDVGGSHWGSGLYSIDELSELVSDMNSIVAWLEADSGNTYENMPQNMKDALAKAGFSENELNSWSQEELLSKVQDKTDDLNSLLNALDAMDLENPDIDAFLDALGERANDFRADAEAYLEAHLHRKEVDKIVEKAGPWISAHNSWMELYGEFLPDGAERPYPGDPLTDIPPEPKLSDYISGSEMSTVGLDDSATPQDLLDAHAAAKEAEQDAWDVLADRGFDPVSPDDANPDNGNQWDENEWPNTDDEMGESSAMAAASAMLSEDDNIDDIDGIV